MYHRTERIYLLLCFLSYFSPKIIIILEQKLENYELHFVKSITCQTLQGLILLLNIGLPYINKKIQLVAN